MKAVETSQAVINKRNNEDLRIIPALHMEVNTFYQNKDAAAI